MPLLRLRKPPPKKQSVSYRKPSPLLRSSARTAAKSTRRMTTEAINAKRQGGQSTTLTAIIIISVIPRSTCVATTWTNQLLAAKPEPAAKRQAGTCRPQPLSRRQELQWQRFRGSAGGVSNRKARPPPQATMHFGFGSRGILRPCSRNTSGFE